jgi:hypothetical protein
MRAARVFVVSVVVSAVFAIAVAPGRVTANAAARTRTLANLPASAKQYVKKVYDPRFVRTPLAARALLTGARTKRNGTTENRPYLSARDYADLRDGAIEVLERFPPDTHYYVGIGRSPTPVIALLQNLNSEIASTIPVSGLKVRNDEATTPPPITLDAAWTQHLAHFLPDSRLAELERSGRGIVVLDRATTGASVTLMANLIRRYVAQRGRSIRVDAVAFTRHPVSVHQIDLTDRGELRLMNKYEPWTEWPYYQVGIDAPSGLVRRPEYDRFKQQLMERMKRDPALNF